jgi:hypothetical protein
MERIRYLFLFAVGAGNNFLRWPLVRIALDAARAWPGTVAGDVDKSGPPWEQVQGA